MVKFKIHLSAQLPERTADCQTTPHTHLLFIKTLKLELQSINVITVYYFHTKNCLSISICLTTSDQYLLRLVFAWMMAVNAALPQPTCANRTYGIK